jgi:site-specific recombinase XerD
LFEQLADHVVSLDARALVFTTSSGAPLRSSNFRQRIWLPATDACGLAGLRVHDLRHTAASLAVKSGANPKVVQQLLGHAFAMTLDVYAGLFNADLEDVATGWTKRRPGRPVCPGVSPGRTRRRR